jgi:hypothetical protein
LLVNTRNQKVARIPHPYARIPFAPPAAIRLLLSACRHQLPPSTYEKKQPIAQPRPFEATEQPFWKFISLPFGKKPLSSF